MPCAPISSLHRSARPSSRTRACRGPFPGPWIRPSSRARACRRPSPDPWIRPSSGSPQRAPPDSSLASRRDIPRTAASKRDIPPSFGVPRPSTGAARPWGRAQASEPDPLPSQRLRRTGPSRTRELLEDRFDVSSRFLLSRVGKSGAGAGRSRSRRPGRRGRPARLETWRLEHVGADCENRHRVSAPNATASWSSGRSTEPSRATGSWSRVATRPRRGRAAGRRHARRSARSRRRRG